MDGVQFNVQEASFLLTLRNSLKVIENDCGKKINLYEYLIPDINENRILVVTLDDTIVYNQPFADYNQNKGNLVRTPPFKATIRSTDMPNIFSLLKVNESILVCGHPEKHESLYPLFTSFASDTVDILIPRNLEKAYAGFSSTSTSQLTNVHEAILDTLKKVSP